MRFGMEGFESKTEEDSGMSKILEFSSPEHEIFVRLLSWDRTKKHKELTELINSGIIRVTIENADYKE